MCEKEVQISLKILSKIISGMIYTSSTTACLLTRQNVVVFIPSYTISIQNEIKARAYPWIRRLAWLGPRCIMGREALGKLGICSGCGKTFLEPVDLPQILHKGSHS